MGIYNHWPSNSHHSYSLQKVTEFDHPHLIGIGGLSVRPSRNMLATARDSDTLARGDLQTKRRTSPASCSPHAHLRPCSIQLTH